MPLDQLEFARFIKRDNRFRAEIEINHQRFKAHVPNSGRMAELLTEGANIWIKASLDSKRKTPYSLVLVEHKSHLICLNAHMANDILAFWLNTHQLAQFADMIEFQREYTWGNSRFDFLIKTQDSACLVEVKSVNLVVDRQARFPDAPTSRGLKHLRELMAYQQQGGCSRVVFMVMGGDADGFAPNWHTDPDFAQGLMEAISQGVEVIIYKCNIDLDGIAYGGVIPF